MVTQHAPPLRRLKRLELLPNAYTARSRALSLLRRIGSIDIRETTKHNGARHYAIDIFYKSSPLGIPTNPKTRRPLSSVPDVRVLRRFSEFTNLCSEMYFHAHVGHAAMPCGFCGACAEYANASVTQPRLVMKLLCREDRVRRLLEQFLNDVLGMTVRGVKAFGGRECLGQEHIPLLLLEFLLPQEASPLGEMALRLSVHALREATAAAAREETVSRSE